ncbi:MAG: hypothetical protein OHK0046_42540 [Anaerolineae bacterium]
MSQVQAQFITSNGLQLAYYDHGGTGETLLLLHGLSANAHYFDGLIGAGLNKGLRVIAVDLRGRGESDKPEGGFTKRDHAQDIIGLMEGLGLAQAVIGGHSYGARLGMFMAVHYPEHVKKLVVMDAGYFAPDVVQLIMPSLERLDQVFPSEEAYLDLIKASPYYDTGFWDAGLEAYYRADLQRLPDGTYTTRSRRDHIMAIAAESTKEDWDSLMASIQQPVLLLQAPDGVGQGKPPILTDANAVRTAAQIPHCTYRQMSGNHMTMGFGPHAAAIVKEIHAFINAG